MVKMSLNICKTYAMSFPTALIHNQCHLQQTAVVPKGQHTLSDIIVQIIPWHAYTLIAETIMQTSAFV